MSAGVFLYPWAIQSILIVVNKIIDNTNIFYTNRRHIIVLLLCRRWFTPQAYNENMSNTGQHMQLYNSLSDSAKSARSHFTNALLTLYGAVVSGLFIFISTSEAAVRLSMSQKIMLVTILLSAVTIVFICLMEKGLTYFGDSQMLSSYVDQVSKGQRSGQLLPGRFARIALKFIPALLVLLIFTNSVAICIYSLVVLF